MHLSKQQGPKYNLCSIMTASIKKGEQFTIEAGMIKNAVVSAVHTDIHTEKKWQKLTLENDQGQILEVMMGIEQSNIFNLTPQKKPRQLINKDDSSVIQFESVRA